MSQGCMKFGHVGGTECVTCAEHAVFKAAAERRKQNGIKLRRICFMAEPSQVEAFNELYSGWVQRFGKSKTPDVLIKLMATVETRIRERESAPKQTGSRSNKGGGIRE